MVKVLTKEFPKGSFKHQQTDGFYLDGWLKSNLDILIKSVKQDRDCLIIIDGKEREGKSTIACQMAKYVDPTYNVDRCCLTPDDFIDEIRVADKYQAIVLDEGMGFGSRSAMSHLNKRLVKVLSEVGAKNLFLFICIPCFFELDRYPAIWRSQVLIHIYPKEMKRGQFAFWSYKRKKSLYLMGKKFYSYKKPKPNFIGSFESAFPINKKEYDKKKQFIIDKTGESDVLLRTRSLQAQRNELIKWLVKENKTMTAISERLKENTGFSLTITQISRIAKENP